MTTLASRAKALLARFGGADYEYHADDGYYAGMAKVDDLRVHVTAVGPEHESLMASVQYSGGDDWEVLLSLQNVRDDDVVESIIRQVIDHHDGKQVV